MSDIRINALATTAASTASDDFIAVDGSANGTRKLSAYSPTFGGNLTVSGSGPSSISDRLNIASVSNDNGASAATTNVRIGRATSTRSTIVLDTSDTTYTNRAWSITNLGATGTFLIGRSGLDALTINNDGNATLAGNLTVAGTGTSSVAGNLGVGTASPVSRLHVAGPSINDGDAYFNTFIRNDTTAATSSPKTGILFSGYYYGTSSFANYSGIVGGKENATDNNAAGYLSFNTSQSGYSPAERMRITSGGNLLLGNTVNATGLLQLGTTSSTTSAGGIGFGTDAVLYRNSAGRLTFAGLGNNPYLSFKTDSTSHGQIAGVDGSMYFDSATGGSIYLRPNGGYNALTLDSSLNATFAGRVTATGSAGLTLSGGGSVIAGTGLITLVRNSVISWNANSSTQDQYIYADSSSNLKFGTSNTLALTLDSSQNATFAGTVTAGTWASGTADKLQLSTTANNYVAQIVNTASSGSAYGLRLHTNRATSSDALLVATSGAGSGSSRFVVKANGTLNAASLPTSSAGLSAGDIWNDGGTLKIV